MNNALPAAFVEKQRDRLMRLRQQLLSSTRAAQSEQIGLNDASAGEAQESEDDAQRLALLEVDAEAAARSQQRLVQIERALQKITDGTYGVSDVSGKSIPRERLEAVPESTCTLAEAQALDADSGRADGRDRNI